MPVIGISFTQEATCFVSSIVPLGKLLRGYRYQAKNSVTPCEDAGKTNQRFSAHFRPTIPGYEFEFAANPCLILFGPRAMGSVSFFFQDS